MADDIKDDSGLEVPLNTLIAEEITVAPGPHVASVAAAADPEVDSLVESLTRVLLNDNRFSELDSTTVRIQETVAELASLASSRLIKQPTTVKVSGRKFGTLSEFASHGTKRKLKEESPPPKGAESSEEEEGLILTPPSAEEREVPGLVKSNALFPRQDGDAYQAISVEALVTFTDPAVMDRDLIPALNRAWRALFGGKTSEDLSRIVTAICLYFACNSTSPRIPPKEKISILIGDKRVDHSLDSIVSVAFTVTGEREIRRIMRAYADFTRESLRRNPHIRTKMFQEFNLSQNQRAVAFDFSDYCRNPPLSTVEESMLSAARAKVLQRTAAADAWQKDSIQGAY